MRITVLCENTVGRPLPLLGEHGFSCLVETDAGRLLFDTGRGLTLLHNLDQLKIAPESIDAIVLSHGHDDHSGGLLALLRRTGPRPVYAHPGIFIKRAFVRGDERRSIGLAASRAELEAAGARFRFLAEHTELAQGIWFSGHIPRISPFEQGDPSLVAGDGMVKDLRPDPFDDDAALAIDTSQGIVVVLGCAHAGVINTVEHLLAHAGERPLRAIIGGTHLGPVSEKQFGATVAYMDSLGKIDIGVGHCTGQVRGALLHQRFPGQVFYASVGSVFEVI